MALSKQMEMFEDGGLKDEGGMIDEVSGNDVPSGSTREEVRDDIPAQLSEGEFVFPADVVRFIGLEKLMQMRQKAKMGLQKMEDMGQMGNSEEATIPDDMPFSIDDLDIEEEVDNQAEMEYNKGGVVYAQQGAYIPNVGKAYQPPAAPNAGTPYAPATFTDLLGTSAVGAPKTQNVRYVNEATGQVRMIPHVLNPDGSIGNSLYPKPDGFVRKEEAPKEAAKPTQVQSTKVAPVDTGGDDGGAGLDGGASLSFGGDKSGAGKGLQSNAITANISYNINPFGPMGVLGSLITVNNINKGKDVTTIGNKFGLTTNPVTMTYGKGKSISFTSPQYAKVKNNPTGKEAKDLANRMETLDSLGKNNISYDQDLNVYTDQNGKEVSVDTMSQAGKDIADHISHNVSLDRGTTEGMARGLTDSEIEALSQHNTDVEDEESFSGSGEVSQGATTGFGDSDGFGYGGTEDTPESFDSGDYEATGGLLTKRKASGKIKDKWKKKMKRGGLASR